MSFLLRLWREQPDGGELASYYGEIEHIQSGMCWRFASFELLLTFLQRAAIAPQCVTRITLDELKLLAGDSSQS
jgi:hypothetical protein